jgi:uncharacterized membrane protein
MTDIFSGFDDFFNMFNLMFIIIFVGALVFLIIVIIVVYKLLHSNVDNTSKKSGDILSDSSKNPYRKGAVIEEPKLERCPYCGEKIEPNIAYCPICGVKLQN